MNSIDRIHNSTQYHVIVSYNCIIYHIKRKSIKIYIIVLVKPQEKL